MRKVPAPAPQPLKPLVFQVLLALVDGDRHGWSLVREVQQRGSFAQIMPGNFYRTLRGMLSDGLIRSEEHTSELQSHVNLVCRLLLEKKKTNERKYPRSRMKTGWLRAAEVGLRPSCGS